ncbi:hypothetical protein BD410DRAFT_795337 [Rickenella mellea]|uniref:Regulator of volume decrease after cellular swelling-domain-containing protein n=1 Tax=Rickenella mellea TaxID=50990 RepID=A0A4Y7PM64_9AGAM|nr:hypothetical protein BD410DRAFT_795337 [Rickenella mellea]
MPAFTFISAVPSFITPEEHRELVATTPASFNDIPSVLRHQEDNVSVSILPTLDGFGEEDCVKGTLYIVESVLAFISSTGRGFQVDYPSITLHATSREPRPSIYCQLDDIPEDAALDGRANGDGENDDDNDDAELRELHLIPQDASSLEPMFEALSLCASLHPDPARSDDDDLGEDYDDEAFVDADESGIPTYTGQVGGEEELTEVGRVRSDFINDNRYTPY